MKFQETDSANDELRSERLVANDESMSAVEIFFFDNPSKQKNELIQTQVFRHQFDELKLVC